MKNARVLEEDFIHLDSLNPESKVVWTKDQTTEEMVYTTWYQDDIDGGRFEIIETSDDTLSMDFAHLFETYFPTVLEKVDQVLLAKDQKNRPEARKILWDAKNWEVLVSKAPQEPIQDAVQDTVQDTVFHFLFRPIRNKLFQVPKNAELVGLAKDATELAQMTTFRVNCIIDKVSESAEVEIDAVPDQIENSPEPVVEEVVIEPQVSEVVSAPVSKPQAEVWKKKKEKKKEEKKEKVRGKTVIQVKNPNKYDLKKVLSWFTAPEVGVFEGEVSLFNEHLIAWAKSFLNPEFMALVNTRWAGFKIDLHKDSVIWIEKIPLEKREELIASMLPEYLKLISQTCAGAQTTARNQILGNEDFWWDIFCFEALVVRTFAQAGKYSELIHFLENIRVSTQQIAVGEKDNSDNGVVDVRAGNKILRRSMVAVMAHGWDKMYQSDIKKMMYEYVLTYVRQVMTYEKAVNKEVPFDKRIQFIIAFIDGSNYNQLLDTDERYDFYHEILNLVCGIARFTISPKSYADGKEIFRNFMTADLPPQEAEAVNVALDAQRRSRGKRDWSFMVSFQHAVKLYDIPKA